MGERMTRLRRFWRWYDALPDRMYRPVLIIQTGILTIASALENTYGPLSPDTEWWSFVVACFGWLIIGIDRFLFKVRP